MCDESYFYQCSLLSQPRRILTCKSEIPSLRLSCSWLLRGSKQSTSAVCVTDRPVKVMTPYWKGDAGETLGAANGPSMCLILHAVDFEKRNSNSYILFTAPGKEGSITSRVFFTVIETLSVFIKPLGLGKHTPKWVGSVVNVTWGPVDVMRDDSQPPLGVVLKPFSVTRIDFVRWSFLLRAALLHYLNINSVCRLLWPC